MNGIAIDEFFVEIPDGDFITETDGGYYATVNIYVGEEMRNVPEDELSPEERERIEAGFSEFLKRAIEHLIEQEKSND